jgi:toxin FitB
MKWLLDTNVLSEGTRPRPDLGVLAWMSSQPREQMAISIVTVAQLRDGAATATDERRRRQFEQWIETDVAELFADRMLPLTLEILVQWLFLGRKLFAKGRPRSAPDLLIAATAWVHGLIVVSRNFRDFAGTGVVVFNPWTGKTHHMESP